VLTLASISRESSKPAEALMQHFPSFATTFQDSLISPWSSAPTDKASTINHCYTSVKLWLLLAQKLCDGDSMKSRNYNSTTFMIWNELWPPFLHMLTELTTNSARGLNAVSAIVVLFNLFTDTRAGAGFRGVDFGR
jgi:hypothetical protein